MHIVLVAVSAATAPAGVCRHAANLARGLQSMNGVDQVTLITGAWQAGYFENSLGLTGNRLHILPIDIPNTSLSRNAWYLFRLPALVKTLRANILHLTFPAPFLRSLLSVPVVLTLHDLYPLDLPRNFGNRAWLNRLALRIALHNADTTVCVSFSTLRRLREAYPTLHHPSITIPHPVSSFGPSGSSPLPQELQHHPFLLCVAQHRANKNLITLVRGFNAALQSKTLAANTRLVIVGNQGPETKALIAEVASLGLIDQVLFFHGLPDALLATLYRRCELFIAASIMEGFGLPVAEAIAHGSRVLCSDIPTFHELGAGSCTLFPVNSTAAQLAAWITVALGAPRSPHNSRFFTHSQAANRYLSVYQSLLQSRNLRSTSVTTSESLSTGDA